MTLQQIYYALTVAETGSMNKAAEKLIVSQPSLSGAIKVLERYAGIKIFLRTSKGMTVTGEGAEFLTYARQVYQQYELLLKKYGETGDIKRKFGVSAQHYSFAVKAFVEMVKHFDTRNYEFAIRETKTYDVIQDVGTLRSEIGILYLSSFNRKIIEKMLCENELSFHHLVNCQAHVYLWNGHPLAGEKSIRFKQLREYPCLSFEQGERGSFYFAEEILSENHYGRIIKACDRATMLNLMVGLNGYTLCSGIICNELNGDDYVAVAFELDEENQSGTMEIGYIKKKYGVLSEIGEIYLGEIRRYLRKTEL
ncbi:MAG: LysR family transcriptional regulator [Oscillospiraceae bacterium]|nr:LysR family transcriptional regulator [Oscillospiraceae bacterium]